MHQQASTVEDPVAHQVSAILGNAAQQMSALFAGQATAPHADFPLGLEAIAAEPGPTIKYTKIFYIEVHIESRRWE